MAETYLGLDGKLNFKVGGQAGGGGWTELTNCQDVTATLQKGEADVTTRASGGWEQVKGALKKLSLEWKMIWDPEDAGFQAVKNAFFNDELIGLQCLDKQNGQGPQADFEVLEFSRPQPLGEAQVVNVKVKIGRSATPPSWIGG